MALKIAFGSVSLVKITFAPTTISLFTSTTLIVKFPLFCPTTKKDNTQEKINRDVFIGRIK